MRRVLLLIASLAAALALFWIFVGREGVAPSALAPQPQEIHAAQEEPRLNSTVAHDERQVLASAPAALPALEPSPVPPDFVGPPAPQTEARKTVTVSVSLRFADTHEPVGRVLGYLSWGMDEARSRGMQLESAGAGTFTTQAPVGSRLTALQLYPAAEDIAGPSTSANVAGRFRPFLASLDRLVEQSDLELSYELERGHELRGIVRDAASRAPIPDAEVELVPRFGAPARWITAADGRFVFGDAGSKLSLRASQGESSPYFRTLDEAEFEPGAPELEVLLERGLRVTGRVVDGNGAALEGVDLHLVVLGAMRSEFNTRTKEDGSFTFTRVPPTWSASLTGKYDGKLERLYLGARVDLGALREDVADLVLVNPESTCIQVYVQDSEGNPVGPWACGLECDAPHLMEPNLYNGDPKAYLHGSIDWKDVRISTKEIGRTVLVPIGVPLHLRAVVLGDPSKLDRVSIGESRLVLERKYDPPLEVRIALGKPFDASQPLPAGGTHTLMLSLSACTSVLDLRLLDPRGEPLPERTHASFEGDQLLGDLELADGWVRLQGPSGRTRVRVTSGRLHGVLQLELPAAGSARAEARLEEGP